MGIAVCNVPGYGVEEVGFKFFMYEISISNYSRVLFFFISPLNVSLAFDLVSQNFLRILINLKN